MPSTKAPTTLRIGPGRVPSNVVTSSGLTSLPGSTPTASTPPINVVSVSSNTTLTRVGQYMVVIVDNSGGAITVTLPTGSQIGDLITIVIKTTSLNLVTVARGGSDTIQGFTTSETLSGPYEARTFVRASTSDWTTEADKPAVRTLTTTTTLLRAGPQQLVLVDSTSGVVIVTLPQRAQVGDRVTVVKAVATNNPIQVQGAAGDTVDGRVSTNIDSLLQSVTVVRVGSGAWATLSETSSIIEITDTFTLSGVESAKEIHVLVHTANAAWIAGTKTISLPSALQTRPGQIVTISDVDGNAELSNITIGSQVLGTTPAGTGSFTLSHNYAAVTLINKASVNWTILGEDLGLAPNFSSLSRADTRSDTSQSRLSVLPMFNWSQRKVALHAEFNGLITNILPVDGFSAGGTMSLANGSNALGTVGVMRTTTTAGTSGYLHWGGLPTSTVFDPTQLLGFRAIITPISANPGSDYDILVGFGDDISESTGSDDQKLGANGLYVTTGTGTWRGVRQASGTGSGFNSASTVTQNNRYVIEYYNTGTNWDLFINGSRTAGGSTNKPAVQLNFGLQVLNGVGVSPYIVDIDALTVFTLDLGNTRHNP